MQDDALLGTFHLQYVSRLEAIRAGDGYGASYPPHHTAARHVVWLATSKFRFSIQSAFVTHFQAPSDAVYYPFAFAVSQTSPLVPQHRSMGTRPFQHPRRAYSVNGTCLAVCGCDCFAFLSVTDIYIYIYIYKRQLSIRPPFSEIIASLRSEIIVSLPHTCTIKLDTPYTFLRINNCSFI